jgi:hypothetical protein
LSVKDRISEIVGRALSPADVRSAFLEEMRTLISSLLLRTKQTSHASLAVSDEIDKAHEAVNTEPTLMYEASRAVGERFSFDTLEKFMQPGGDRDLKESMFTLIIIEMMQRLGNTNADIEAIKVRLIQEIQATD